MCGVPVTVPIVVFGIAGTVVILGWVTYVARVDPTVVWVEHAGTQ